MIKYSILSFAFALFSNAMFSQETIYSEDFNGEDHTFNLNVPIYGGQGGTQGSNYWVVNDAYQGGQGKAFCFDFPVPFLVTDTQDQPAGISGGPNSSYLHIASSFGVDSGIECASYAVADGFCSIAADHWAALDTPIDLTNFIDVELSFWWMCQGGSAFGSVYASTDGGDNWSWINDQPFFGVSEWSQISMSLSDYEGEESLLLAFRFSNIAGDFGGAFGEDPPFCIDDIFVSGEAFGGCEGDPTFAEIAVEECGPYFTPSGAVVTETSVFEDIIPNSIGCDSIITIDLTILATSASESGSGCDSYTSASGQLYEATGVYQEFYINENDCKSILTVDVEINNSTFSNMTEESCQPWQSPAGNIYEESGVYTEVLTTSAGCDSTIVIDLTVGQHVFQTEAVSSCDAYLTPWGETLTTDGTYSGILPTPTPEGCDSTLSIDFTLISLSTDILLSAFGFEAAQQNATYQWVDCDNDFAPIEGATERIFTPTSNGSYAVEITQGDCTVISECAAAIGINVAEIDGITINPPYPNPSNGNVYIDVPEALGQVSVSVFNALGQIVSEGLFSSGKIEVRLPQEAGFYSVRVFTSDANFAQFRIIRNN